MELGKISNIQTGLMLARKRATSVNHRPEKYKLLTLKSLENTGRLNLSQLDIFFSEDSIEGRYFTKKGDIIVRLTTPYTSIVISNEEGILISSNFAIIRLKDSAFIPEYISLYLNSKEVKKEFSKSSISKTIPLIKISHLREIIVSPKSLEIQEKIIRFNMLQQKEKILLEKLSDEKEKFTNSILNKLLIAQ